MDIDLVPPVPAAPALCDGGACAAPIVTPVRATLVGDSGRTVQITLGGPQAPMCARRSALVAPPRPGPPPPSVYVCEFEGAAYWLRSSDIRVACLACHSFACDGACRRLRGSF